MESIYHNAVGNTWKFSDNLFLSGSSIGFMSDTIIPSFQVGETVDIKQDPGYVNESYNGIHQVLKVNKTVKPYYVEVSGKYGVNTPANPGTMTSVVSGGAALSPQEISDINKQGDQIANELNNATEPTFFQTTPGKITIGLLFVGVLLGGVVAYKKYGK